MMTIDQLLTSLESHEKVLAQHIEMAKAGKIQEDCICCREKDLQEIRDQLACVRAMFDDLTALQEEVNSLRDSVEFHKKRGNALRDISAQRGDIIEYLQTILAILRGRLADKMNFDEHSNEVTLFFDGELVIWRLKKGEFDLLRLWAEGKK